MPEPRAYVLADVFTPDAAASDQAASSLIASSMGSPRQPGHRAHGLIGQFSIGQVLETHAGRYRIQRLERRGEHCDTYAAEVLSRVEGTCLPRAGERVIVKIPRVPDDMTDPAAAHRLGILIGLFDVEAETLKRLADVRGIARFIDRGAYTHRLQSASRASVFVVQEYVDGDELLSYLTTHFPVAGRFRGIRDAKMFFRWARTLATIVLEIHRRLVVHGFIWPENILVNRAGEPVLVDFGESLFAQVMDAPGRLSDRAARYVAPEQTRDVGSDLFALGGVLFYLATGEDPPRPYEDIEVLKQQVETSIRVNNEKLFLANCGIADIVAPCLRYSHRGRVESAVKLLRDLDTFDVPSVSDKVAREARILARRAIALDSSSDSLLAWMAVLHIRELTSVIDDMTRGVFDLAGDPATIRRIMAGLMSSLEEGDEFLAVALSKFWWPANIGINGRFWSKTKEAIERGVTVRRVFLMDKTLSDRHLDQIVAAQRSVELSRPPNCSVRYLLLENEEREQMVREGKHFGLFVKDGVTTAFFPQYRADSTLETVRFRTDPAIVRGLHDVFKRVNEDPRSAPLADLKLSAVKVG